MTGFCCGAQQESLVGRVGGFLLGERRDRRWSDRMLFMLKKKKKKGLTVEAFRPR